MVTVRFPTGFSVQYNSASFIESGVGFHRLLKEKDGAFIARVPLDCIVEFTAPCRTYNPISTDSDKVQAQVAELSREIRSLKRALAKKAKAS